MGSVSKKWLTGNTSPDTVSIYHYLEEEHTNYFKAKIRGFYTTIRGLIFNIINKTMQNTGNDMHHDGSADRYDERSHNRHLTRDK